MEELKIIPTVIFEDSEIIVIDKPAGITVNRSDTTIHEATIQDWIEETGKVSRAPNVSQVPRESEFYDRSGIVHRLDKETSGILLAAKNQESFIQLQSQFKERTVKKEYRALVHGKLVPKEGEINIPVGRLPWNRKQFGIVPGGREAVTFYYVEKYYELKDSKEILSSVKLEPQTGRTHQLRVHMKYLNHPIFSDFLYAGRKTALKDRKMLPRVFLHAAHIAFQHPRTKERLHYASPLAQELQQFMHSYLSEL